MDKERLVLFMVLAMGIVLTHTLLSAWIAGPQVELAQQEQAQPKEGDAQVEDDDDAAADAAEPGNEPAAEPVAEDAAVEDGDGAVEESADEPAAVAAADEPPATWVALGRVDQQSPYKLLVSVTNVGAAVTQIELVEQTRSGHFRFQNLDDRSGYLGNLALTMADEGGCQVNLVPPGTPAARAKPRSTDAPEGLQPGDIILRVNGEEVPRPTLFERLAAKVEPGRDMILDIVRGGQPMQYTAHLIQRPFVLMGPEAVDPQGPGVIPSFRMRLGAASTRIIKDLVLDPGLANRRWEITRQETDLVEFQLRSPAVIQDDGTAEALPLEFIKRYRLVPPGTDEQQKERLPGYQLALEIEVRNVGPSPRKLAYQLEGPNGLTTEGWWYSTKIHPSFFGSAGARDLVWNAVGVGHQIRSARELYKQVQSETPEQPLFVTETPENATLLRYIGVDGQYFAVAMLPEVVDQGKTLQFDEVTPLAVGGSDELDKSLQRLTNVSFRVTTPVRTIEPGASFQDAYTVFAGPKDADVLAAYGLGDVIYYGWFPWVARPLARVLHFFYAIVRNYGLAIIMLTVLVRACMFPLSRKAAKNAAMMQQLAPEMKKIADKYKNDMEKRVKAQRELYAKYNFNPFSGCLLVFLQLPIFIGLYRCLSVDIELRQAALIPGLDWASNLAGPDMLWRWPLPEFLAGKTGFLGPYLNILPVITVVLFLAQQKLFTPPAMDEQQKMQQQMMKFMMVFIGVMFFKVPAGLCIYFIASSVWGITERMLLPKPAAPDGGTPPPATSKAAPRPASPNGNGSSNPRRPARRPKKR